MKKYFDILKNCPLFYGINSEDLLAMLGCLNAKILTFKKKETVISEGTPAKFIGIVLSGLVQLERTDYYGNRSIVTIIQPSELFGESFAFAKALMPISVTACKDTQIMMIDYEKIVYSCSNVCDFHRTLIFNLLKIVSTKNIMLNQKSEITSKRTTREKLMAYLMLEAKKSGSDSFTIPYDRQTLADYLGVDRSGLSVQISKLKSEGIIKCNKNKFKILNHN